MSENNVINLKDKMKERMSDRYFELGFVKEFYGTKENFLRMVECIEKCCEFESLKSNKYETNG